MKELVNKLKGDRVIWSFVALLALFSFMPVFSASSNLAYIGHGTGNTLGYLVKHLAHICIGFLIIYWVHRVPYHYFRAISKVALPVVWFLLALYIIKGNCNCRGKCKSLDSGAVYWDHVSNINFGRYILFIFVARYLSKTKEENEPFQVH